NLSLLPRSHTQIRCDCPTAEVLGYYDSDLYSSPEDATRVMENDQRIMDTGQTEVVEESPDGIRTFLGMKAPYRNEAGEVIGLIGISNDISDRKRIEAEREQLLQQEQAAREAAEQANRIKDEFLAVVSHELRTPLNPILGWSKLLRSGKLPPEKVAAALGTIERNAQQQAQLIDDLLDISRILQNKLTLAIAPVDLAVTVTDALETVRLTAEAKSIQLRSSLADVDPVMGDSGRLQQIVWNLLSNAIKFTPENGRVEVRLEREQGIGNREQGIGNDAGTSNLSPSTSYAQITVRDTGKGILPEFLPHLFEAFRQEDGTTTRKFGGLGLGLSIVQQLVALHGGTVMAASDGEGQGATFTVRLPISLRQALPPACSSSDRLPMDLSGIQILVVDDMIDSQEFVVFALEQAGAIVTPASSAQVAMELLAQMNPDVIISDIGMPDHNGYELLQQIRSDFKQFQTVPAIALSAYASELDRQQALAAGFQHHLAKPIDPVALVKTVALLTQASG
ncbi:MAG: PAS domain S-box protein, partial [Leptolyngbya sp.]